MLYETLLFPNALFQIAPARTCQPQARPSLKTVARGPGPVLRMYKSPAPSPELVTLARSPLFLKGFIFHLGSSDIGSIITSTTVHIHIHSQARSQFSLEGVKNIATKIKFAKNATSPPPPKKIWGPFGPSREKLLGAKTADRLAGAILLSYKTLLP